VEEGKVRALVELLGGAVRAPTPGS
jgi:hypothetical protein